MHRSRATVERSNARRQNDEAFVVVTEGALREHQNPGRQTQEESSRPIAGRGTADPARHTSALDRGGRLLSRGAARIPAGARTRGLAGGREGTGRCTCVVTAAEHVAQKSAWRERGLEA